MGNNPAHSLNLLFQTEQHGSGVYRWTLHVAVQGSMAINLVDDVTSCHVWKLRLLTRWSTQCVIHLRAGAEKVRKFYTNVLMVAILLPNATAFGQEYAGEGYFKHNPYIGEEPARFLGWTQDQCSSNSFYVYDGYNRSYVHVEKGETLGFAPSAEQFHWICGNSIETTTCNRYTDHVILSRDNTGREMRIFCYDIRVRSDCSDGYIWDGANMACAPEACWIGGRYRIGSRWILSCPITSLNTEPPGTTTFTGNQLLVDVASDGQLVDDGNPSDDVRIAAMAYYSGDPQKAAQRFCYYKGYRYLHSYTVQSGWWTGQYAVLRSGSHYQFSRGSNSPGVKLLGSVECSDYP